MSRTIELSLSTKYVRDWGLPEAIREIVQNAMDGQRDGYEMKIKHTGDTLRVSNVGVKLDPKVWLFGESSKQGGNYLGEHGEGLKLAMVVASRLGHKVKIINDDESWTPSIGPSAVFGGEPVLYIAMHKRQKSTGMLTFEVDGISAEAWEMISQRFLFLAKPKEVVETNYATVLLDEEMKGKVFVKGIWVQNMAELSAGYDFRHVSVDRDRRLVSSWDLKYHAAKAWEEAMTQQRVPAATVVQMLASNATDVQDMASSYGSTTVAAKVAEVFREQHGMEAVPVASMAEAREVEHYGRKGVVVQQALVEVLRKNSDMHIDHVRTEAKNSVKQVYSWSDLSDAEKETYRSVVDLVESAAKDLGFGAVEDRLTIVSFGDDKLQGLFKGGKVQVARSELGSFESFLETLVHEVAHAAGGDGSVRHERAEGRIFSRIVSGVRRKS